MAKTIQNLNTMTVAELRELLDGYSDDTPVVFTTSYGDYHSTAQALPIREADEVDASAIVESGYSNSGMAIALDSDDEDDEVLDDSPVLVLSSRGLSR